MRKEPFGVGDFVHTLKRGGRGADIVLDSFDSWRFLQMLYHFNDAIHRENWYRDLEKAGLDHSLKRPDWWGEQKPVVKVAAFTLLDNHFHLLLKEIREGGITDFMQRLGLSMTKHFNERYDEKGSIFQGPYKSVTVTSDAQLRYLSVYIMVKNTFEMYPEGGLKGAFEDFEKAWEWAIQYPYSSLADYAGVRNSPIIDKDVLGEIFPTGEAFKKFARGSLAAYETSFKGVIEGLFLEQA